MKKNKSLTLAEILRKQHPGWILVTQPEQTSFLKVREVFQIAHIDGGPVRVAEINNGQIVIIG